MVIGQPLGFRRGAAWVVAGGAVTLAMLSLATPAGAITPQITEFSAGLIANSSPALIARGADGNLWFTDGNTSTPAIGRVTPAGHIDEFTAGVSGQPAFISGGPDGNLWFTNFSSEIWRINPTTQKVDGFTFGLNSGSQPHWISAGPDGNLWFTDRGTTRAIGRINPTTQKIDEFTTGLPAGSAPTGIVGGPGGNLWFTDRGTTKAIARINPSTQKIDEFTAGLTGANNPQGIVTGSDGNLWFSDFSGPGIGRTTPAGASQVFSAGLDSGSTPTWIAAGADGSVWFTDEGGTPAIGRVTPAGGITEFRAGLNPGASPGGIAAGPDGNLWFTDGGTTTAIGRITTPPVAVTGGSVVLGAGAAMVAGTLNGHAQPTSDRFEFGLTPGYGAGTGSVSAGSGFANVPASATLSGLRANTTYHYRVDVTNPTDTTNGADASFKTPPRPAVGKVRVAPKTWRRGSKRARISKRRKRPPVGTKISFSLNRAVPVRLRFFAIRPGRKVKRKCRAPTRKNRKAKRCKRLVLAGSISFTGHRGKNTVRFQGRISRRKRLKPGRYRLTVTAADPTIRARPSRTASFTIVKG